MAWWTHSQLAYKAVGSAHNETQGKEKNLCLSSVSLIDWANRVNATPFYAYSGQRILEKIELFKSHLESITSSTRIFFAMKSNRNPQVLGLIRAKGLSIDTCSGQEILAALRAGFAPSQISFTSAAITEEDLKILSSNREIFVNLDSCHQIKLLGEHCPGRQVGMRINPQAGYGYSSALEYSKAAQVTKFGIYEQEFPEALSLAAGAGLKITGLHCHSGWGLQNRSLENVAAVMKRITEFAQMRKVHPATDSPLLYINIGGGLGTPLASSDTPLEMNRWATLVKENLLHCFSSETQLFAEPGDFLVRDSGILVTKVLSSETKMGVHFVVVDASFAVNLQQASYQLPFEALPLVSNDSALSKLRPTRVVGAINEAVDVFINSVNLPELRPGSYIAFPAVGAYGATMASNHCMRGNFEEYFFPG
jgi:diaminopimelate decarboxylase